MGDASFWSNDAQPTIQRVVTVAASVTASSAGAATTVMALTKPRFLLLAHSTLNQDVSLVIGDDDFWRFPLGGHSIAIDLRSNQMAQMTGQVIGIYHHGTAPTTGFLQLTVLG